MRLHGVLSTSLKLPVMSAPSRAQSREDSASAFACVRPFTKFRATGAELYYNVRMKHAKSLGSVS
jgi:hypothetical protein